ncbi:SAM-dependent methyltransferase [Phytohabitans houttuyneae]|uniref:S-adenosyl methyltransferase n=1 Tax=Phytohabitans houttuyneae TaxID=1076126 RepID=A0A6V8KJX4_9ACTN|nr:SAM-dependent methyltransferase [Phytohabitans houttuyneae]GFJ82047.1 hypothetical protein Phou_062270 [Phytohabitans houttuyneae]
MTRPTAAAERRADRGRDARVPWRVCRVWDHLTDGFETCRADREMARQMETVIPGVREMARANRAFTRRVVTTLVAAGVEQYLDLGCGTLSANSVHETLIEYGPAARSVHVDIDVVAVDRAIDRITDNGRAGVAAAIRADLCTPATVFKHPTVRRLLDFDKPLAVIAAGVLAHLDDTAAAGLLATVREQSVDGSFLALTHPTADVHAEVNALTTIGAWPRSRTHVEQLLAGWQLPEPGLVWASQWRPGVAPSDPSPAGRGARYLLAALAATAGGER